jgi:hypothetical protein
MKININQEFWDKTNVFAKVAFVIGWFFIDIAFKLSGMEQK